MFKVLVALLAISCTTSFMNFGSELNLMKTIRQIGELSNENVGSKYDECLNDIDRLNHVIIEVVKLILNQQFDKLPLKIAMIIELVTETEECFRHANGTESLKIDPQCAIDHLKQAGAKVKVLLTDIISGRWSNVAKDWNEIVAILEDIKNC